ncbi:MAG TPA: hypothetical protein VF369_05125 [candidate division Zixibacteria bacterium]
MILPKVKRAFSNRYKNLICYLIIAMIGWIAPFSLAQDKITPQENPPTNEEFLREILRSLFAETFTDFPKLPSDLVVLKAEEDRPENWLLEDELLTYLLSLNYQVGLKAADTNSGLPESKSLFYRIIDLKLDYPETFRKGFLKEKLVTRRAVVNLSLREENPATGKVIWLKRGELEKTDVVRKSMIKSLSNHSYPFLSPSLSGDPMNKYLEPALLTAVVGGVIYLFFANR